MPKLIEMMDSNCNFLNDKHRLNHNFQIMLVVPSMSMKGLVTLLIICQMQKVSLL